MRVVLDSNVTVSALLFNGRTSSLRTLWKSGLIIPLVNGAMLEEYATVLAYSKFKLSEKTIEAYLADELMPWLEPVPATGAKRTYKLRDPLDGPFLAAAFAGKAEALITGDRDILEWAGKRPFEIIRPGEFLDKYFPG